VNCWPSGWAGSSRSTRTPGSSSCSRCPPTPYRSPAAVEIRVSGGPDGPLSWHAVLEPDAAPRYEPGPLPDADASYDQTWDDAVGQFSGGYEPVVAYMQGSLKVKGATRPLYELFRLWADPAHRAATASLLAT